MTASKRAIATVGFVCVAAFYAGQSNAVEALVQWHVVTNGSPTVAFVLIPAHPTTTSKTRVNACQQRQQRQQQPKSCNNSPLLPCNPIADKLGCLQ